MAWDILFIMTNSGAEQEGHRLNYQAWGRLIITILNRNEVLQQKINAKAAKDCSREIKAREIKFPQPYNYILIAGRTLEFKVVRLRS
jgi:hypothetical protein